MQLFRKRWQIRRKGRWPWGTVLVPVILHIVSSTESDMSIHWPKGLTITIPETIRQRVEEQLAKHYKSTFRKLPFTSLCRLPHIISLNLLTDPDEPEEFYKWCDQTFGPYENQSILLVAGAAYTDLFKPPKSKTVISAVPEVTAKNRNDGSQDKDTTLRLSI